MIKHKIFISKSINKVIYQQTKRWLLVFQSGINHVDKIQSYLYQAAKVHFYSVTSKNMKCTHLTYALTSLLLLCLQRSNAKILSVNMTGYFKYMDPLRINVKSVYNGGPVAVSVQGFAYPDTIISLNDRLNKSIFAYNP